jgi:hypothetical protein
MSLLEYPVLRDKVALTRTLVGRRVPPRSIKRLPRNHFFRNLFPNPNPTPIIVSGRVCQTQLASRLLASVKHHRHHRHHLRIICPTETAVQRIAAAGVHTAHCNCSESLTLSPNPCNSRFRKSPLPTPTLPPRLASAAHSKIENG